MTKEMAVTEIGGGAQVPLLLAGRYRVDREIGRGGMGTVHLAQDLVLERRVAIKQLRDVTLSGEQARQRVLHEARALAALRHPGIAAIHDVLDLAPPALVLEYVDGETWDAWLDQGQSPAAVVQAFTSVVRAVAAAHAAGVVHCDLKPANIVVRADGVPTVLDFGIARLGQAGPESSSGSDETRQPAFTPKWAAPEVLRGLTATPAADVYALGVMLEDLPIDCTRARQPLPAALATQLRAVGRRARAESLDIRPADATVLLADLETIGAAAPAAGRPLPGRSSRARALALIAVLVGGGCVTGGLALVREGRATPAGSRGVPLLAVVPRLDPDASATTSAAAADLLRDALGPLTRARLVTAEVPALTADVHGLVEALKDQGLTHVLVPTVATMRSSARLSVAVLKASDGSLVHTTTRFGPPGDLGRLAADAARDLKVWLGEASAPMAAAPAVQPSMLSLGQYSQARQYAERADIPGNLGRAIQLLQQVVTRDPSYVAAHAELGRVYWLQYRTTRESRDLEAAQLSLLDALTRQPDLPETRITLALLMRERGRYPEAAAALHQALAAAPDDDVALRLLGELEAQQGSVDEGVALIERAVMLRPGSWANHRALGSTLFNAGRYVEAGRSFEVLTQLQPDNPWGYQMLGAARQMAGDLDGAVQPYGRSVEIRRTAAALSNLATVQYGRGEFVLAERLYREAVALRPRDAVMHRNLGDALLRQSRKADALQAYTAALEAARALIGVNPADARARGTATYALARLGQCDAAGAEATRTEALGSPNPSVAANMTNAWAICGQWSEAFRMARVLKARGATLTTLLEHDVLERLQARPEFTGLL
jgi:tetratricopeptide (TPR) repeat protein/tRNA A-37 threonylcarbamoyl transferase component Bud32